MNSTTTVYLDRTSSSTWRGKLLDYVEVAKPRIATLVLITVAVGGIVATWGHPPAGLLIHAILGTGLVATSASVWNQWSERATDCLMRRTAHRPISTGRMKQVEVNVFGWGTLLLGLVYLGAAVNLLSAALAFVTWALYVLAYTPLKKKTSWNTLVGAIPGAMPVVIGWAATGRPFDLRTVALFLLVFLWQFPHFMAIAWLYRRDYAAVGIKMMTVVEPTGWRAGLQATVAAMALIPVSLVPAILAPPAMVYVWMALAMGLTYLAFAVRFWRDRNDQTAKDLLKISLIYLPIVMLGLACLPLIS